MATYTNLVDNGNIDFLVDFDNLPPLQLTLNSTEREIKNQEHNYELVSGTDGFAVYPRDANRKIVEVHLQEDGFWNINYGILEPTPLYHFYDLVDSIVDELYRSWKTPKEKIGVNKDFVPIGLSKWMKKQTAKCLNKVVHTEWEKGIKSIKPQTAEVHRKMFSLSCGRGHWRNVRQTLFENNPYLISDVLKYKACRASILFDDKRLWEEDWMLSFAKDKEKYPALNKTIMNLPNGITYSSLPYLKYIRLPEPVYTRLKMLCYMNIASNVTWNKQNYFLDVVHRSTDDDIRKAVKLMWHYFPSAKSGSFKNTREIFRALGLIYDYPDDIGKWDIYGLAKRSEVYHHNVEERDRIARERKEQEDAERYAKLHASNTMLPPIDLPSNKSIQFLNTYDSVLKEGQIMKHCIAQYAERAVIGHSYLFHVDYNGEMASVEVMPDGYVRQSYGPRDTENEASKYGKRILGYWAKELKGKKIKYNEEIMKTLGYNEIIDF